MFLPVHALSALKMFLSIAEDKHIPKLKELTDAIHAEDGKAGIQLWQGGLTVGMDQTAMILLSSDTELAPGFTVPGISMAGRVLLRLVPIRKATSFFTP